ncbi:MAG TPA: winged helix-turn-helix domain-containing protein [Methanocorpusculum sp.]|nr:winged helix-turn-helix domain-containing protein [Methanocorpusculum sp.]HJJ39753.1 winged helix-turn-helix domain-containing protein [Methanocorpusculum sp.]HJJ49362.1 winged helix-turn-helix domain-containing protein [Methanocorpusculum sp.]HJJ56594.1 winged helix-turn-helix domain-containing protein [Methanocorpusculum sp.]HJJ95726.1 winged helix-turn-helix domain-containing protein [Methanocorpusculum sp.]
MPEEETTVILEQGSPEALKVAKAMSSATASTLLNLLSEGPMTATDLADRTDIPLTTIKYHLENLQDAGLIEVADVRWSEKGRQMKRYRVIQKDIIITPKKTTPVKKMVERYGIAAGVLTACCAAVPLLSRLVLGSAEIPSTNEINLLTADSVAGSGFETVKAMTLASPTPIEPSIAPPVEYVSEVVQSVDIISQIDFGVILFFFVSLGILILLLVITLVGSRRE